MRVLYVNYTFAKGPKNRIRVRFHVLFWGSSKSGCDGLGTWIEGSRKERGLGWGFLVWFGEREILEESYIWVILGSQSKKGGVIPSYHIIWLEFFFYFLWTWILKFYCYYIWGNGKEMTFDLLVLYFLIKEGPLLPFKSKVLKIKVQKF